MKGLGCRAKIFGIRVFSLGLKVFCRGLEFQGALHRRRPHAGFGVRVLLASGARALEEGFRRLEA